MVLTGSSNLGEKEEGSRDDPGVRWGSTMALRRSRPPKKGRPCAAALVLDAPPIEAVAPQSVLMEAQVTSLRTHIAEHTWQNGAH